MIKRGNDKSNANCETKHCKRMRQVLPQSFKCDKLVCRESSPHWKNIIDGIDSQFYSRNF